MVASTYRRDAFYTADTFTSSLLAAYEKFVFGCTAVSAAVKHSLPAIRAVEKLAQVLYIQFLLFSFAGHGEDPWKEPNASFFSSTVVL